MNNGKPGTGHGITYEQCIHRLVVLFLLDITRNADVEGTLESNIVLKIWNETLDPTDIHLDELIHFLFEHILLDTLPYLIENFLPAPSPHHLTLCPPKLSASLAEVCDDTSSWPLYASER